MPQHKQKCLATHLKTSFVKYGSSLDISILTVRPAHNFNLNPSDHMKEVASVEERKQRIFDSVNNKKLMHVKDIDVIVFVVAEIVWIQTERWSNVTSQASGGKYKSFKIYRWNPETPHIKPHLQEYTIDLHKCGRMVLDALIKIKAECDPTLTFRRSCREGICGTCSMNIGGINTLACITKISSLGKGTTKIYPLPHMYVIRDLVPDMTHFYGNYAKVQPWLQRRDGDDTSRSTTPYMQSIRDQEKMEGFLDCILCNCCSQACPPYWWHYNNGFLGPALLLQAYRWLIDSRDQKHKERLDRLKDKFSVFQCHTIMNCTSTCPRKLNPGLAINEIKRMLMGLTKKEKPDMESASGGRCPN